MARIEELKQRLKKVRSQISSLENEERELEFLISGGESWKGTFREVFGSDGPVVWEGKVIVPERLYSGLFQGQILNGAVWAGTFDGPAHCKFNRGEMPVVMRGSLGFLNWKRCNHTDRKALKKLAAIKKVSLVCPEDIVAAIDWAKSVDLKKSEKHGGCRNYMSAIAHEFGFIHHNPRLRPASILIEGRLISPYSIAESMKRKGANKRSDKASRIAFRFQKAADIQIRRTRRGRHEWADSLKSRSEILHQIARDADKSEQIEKKAEDMFSEILKTGMIDKKLRKLIAA